MTKRKKIIYGTCFITAFLIMTSLFTNLLLSHFYAERQYKAVNNLVGWFIGEHPEDEQRVIRYIKEYDLQKSNSEKSYLDMYGFDKTELWKAYKSVVIISSICCPLLFIMMLAASSHLIKSNTRSRIKSITEYLTKVNSGKDASIFPNVEDDFSTLEDEIYKSVTEMRIARETAIKERKNFAESLENIAHQIKTPVASLSLSIQMLKGELSYSEIQKLREQIDKINHLIDALLTVSRIDSGTLKLKNENVNVYTLLELAVEAIDIQIKEKNIKIELPNHPEISFVGDLDWSVEAFINLIKNSIEHMENNGQLTFSYEGNPLYVEITLTDDGEGFDEKEIPYIFDRFYSGSAKKSGTGIGLSMAKSIIEMQNGFITAKNLHGRGACFIIRFYCH